jgi:CubicO group peptidase (beta-lactamase class C family)
MTSKLLILPATLLLVFGASLPAQPLPGPPGPAKPALIAEPVLVRRLTTSLDSLTKLDQFSGVVVVAKRGAPVFQRAYGMADREAGTPNNVETGFNLGSINKIFTMTAMRQLAADGKVNLDSTLAKYWPDYPNAEVARKVTIRQLLRHTSGIGGDVFDPPAGGKRNDIRRLEDYLPLFVNAPMKFEPGARNAYSNAGYVVLGLLIQRLSGQDYYTYVKQHIFDPAGMRRTESYAVDALPSNTAIGYTRGEDPPSPNTPLRRNTTDLPGRGSSAGGGYSTAQDLLRFLQALRSQTIANGPPTGFGIAGGSGGMNAVVETDMPGGYDVIVLANLDPPAAERVARMVRGWLGASDD